MFFFILVFGFGLYLFWYWFCIQSGIGTISGDCKTKMALDLGCPVLLLFNSFERITDTMEKRFVQRTIMKNVFFTSCLITGISSTKRVQQICNTHTFLGCFQEKHQETSPTSPEGFFVSLETPNIFKRELSSLLEWLLRLLKEASGGDLGVDGHKALRSGACFFPFTGRVFIFRISPLGFSLLSVLPYELSF